MKQPTARYITLLELMIALSLALIILSALTYFYQQMTLTGAVLERTQKENFQIRNLENRLGTVLTRTISSTDPSNHFHFFTSSDAGGLFMPGSSSLVFTFDNCVQSNKEMSYHVIGRLFLDRDGQLILATWPVESRWIEGMPIPVSHQVLLENVSALSFRFFIPPKKGKTEEEKPAPTPSGETVQTIFPQDDRGLWISDWSMQYRQLPAIVQIIFTKQLEYGERTFIFSYPLPNTLQPIIYDL